jgi:hypothetical protein
MKIISFLLLWFLLYKTFLNEVCYSILRLQVELNRSLEHLIFDKASLLELINVLVNGRSNLCCCLQFTFALII